MLLRQTAEVPHPARSLSITIFCRPEEMPQLASIGGEATCSEDTPGAIICTPDGLDRAALTSRRILGSGPSLEAALWTRGVKTDYRTEAKCPATPVNRLPPLRSTDVSVYVMQS